MKFKRVYNNGIYREFLGYEFDGGFLEKDSHLSHSGNEIVDGWIVEDKYLGKRMFYASSLKEAKDWVRKNF